MTYQACGIGQGQVEDGDEGWGDHLCDFFLAQHLACAMLLVSWPDIRVRQLPGGQIQNADSLCSQWPEPSIVVNGSYDAKSTSKRPCLFRSFLVWD
jgi:hypothetical protein